ncbi:unnamed protein product [Caenorhabditis angaria]|uniref:Uncharacterized protein n=1 Tax=Caenorhabditis angaria TaxID=860376 RepID=A0A9P1N5P7_9PELO|nr:unnamed protein product [Caenorhabditis angaria]
MDDEDEQEHLSATSSAIFDITEDVITTAVVESAEKDSDPTTSEDTAVVCPNCRSPSGYSQFSKSSFRPKNRAQVVWIYRSRCLDPNCLLWFGNNYRFDRGTFIEVSDDGRPINEPKQRIEDEETSRSSSDNSEKAQDVLYPEVPIPPILVTECVDVKCDRCGGNSVVLAYIKAIYRAKTRPWIYKTKCISNDCGLWFGKGMRLDRSSIMRVDDTGRPFGRSQISMKNQEEEEGNSLGFEEDDDEEEDIKLSSIKNKETDMNNESMEGGEEEDCCKNQEEEDGDSNEEEATNQNKESSSQQKVAKPRKRRTKKTGFNSRKQSSIKKRKEKMESGLIPKCSPKPAVRSSRGYVYVLEPIEGVKKEENDDLVLGPRKVKCISYNEETPKKSTEDGNKAKEIHKAKLLDAKNERRREAYKIKQEEKRRAAEKKVSEKQTKRKDYPKNIQENNEIATSTSPSSASSASSSVEYCNIGTQCENELILESEYIKSMYIADLNANFKPEIVVRIKDMPLMVRATLLNMKRIIQEQESQIKESEQIKAKYKELMPKLSEKIRQLRLAYTDDLRRIGDDIIELREEFRQHHIEVISISRKTVSKFDKAKYEIELKYEDMIQKCKSIEAKVLLKEAEMKYEKDRADYFLSVKDRYEQQRNESRKLYKDIENKLSDTVYIRNEQKCTHCQIFEKLNKNMKKEVVEYQMQRDTARKEKEQGDVRAHNAERCAQILSQEVDKLKYESRTWKSQADKLREQNDALIKKNQKLKQGVVIENPNTPKFNTPPSSSTPIQQSSTEPSSSSTPSNIPTVSISSTDNIRKQRVSPLEDGEIDDSSKSPPANCKKGPLPPAKPAPIASGFASWIPKEALNAPAPTIPTLSSPFGVPVQPVKKPEVKLPTSHAPLPWDAKSKLTDGMSDTLKMVAAQVEAERFFGTLPPMKERKKPQIQPEPRAVKPNSEKNTQAQKKQQNSNQWNSPPTKKIKKAMQNQAENEHVAPPSKPPQIPSFDSPSTSGQSPKVGNTNPFGVVKEKVATPAQNVEKPAAPSIIKTAAPAAANPVAKPPPKPQQQQQTPKGQQRNNFGVPNGRGPPAWAGAPKPPHQQQRMEPSFFGSPAGTSDRSFGSSPFGNSGLPWHRENSMNATHVDTPFGKVPIREEAWGRGNRMSNSWTDDTNWTSDGPPRNNFSYFGVPPNQQPPPQNQNPPPHYNNPPQSFMKRSFWD